MPAAAVPPAVRILGLSPSLTPWVSIVLACVLRATQWQAAFLLGPPLVPLAPRAHHGDDGVVVVTCSADLALRDIRLMPTRAVSAHGLAVLASSGSTGGKSTGGRAGHMEKRSYSPPTPRAMSAAAECHGQLTHDPGPKHGGA